MDQAHDPTHVVPQQGGPSVLPNLPIFNRLVNHAHLRNNVCVRDVEANISMTQHQLLTDILRLRTRIQCNPGLALGETNYEKSEVSIGLLAPGGCQFAVGFLATLALGAVCVPLSEQNPRFSVCRTNGADRYSISSPGTKLLRAQGSDHISSGTS